METGKLESAAIQLYGLIVLMTRKESDIDVVRSAWDMMVKICDEYAKRISDLCKDHPFCSSSHDKILDLRNKCVRLRDLHS